MRTIFVSREKREIRRLRKTSTNSTQPRPPRIIRNVMVNSNPGLLTKRAKLPPDTSGNIWKPALLNDATDRNSECQRVRRVLIPSTVPCS